MATAQMELAVTKETVAETETERTDDDSQMETVRLMPVFAPLSQLPY
jgi:hypothetical protein